MTETTEQEKEAPRFIRAFKALKDRRMAAMLLLSFAAGIPYGAVIGSLNAWLTEAGVNPREIGVLSFIILAYSFKFIWSPAFQKPTEIIPSKLGARRSWLLICQILIAVLLVVLALTNPAGSLALVAGAALLIALASATHDIVLDAWRIEVAETDEDLDLMSALYQFGYRLAGLLTGALALVLAARIGWNYTYMLLAVGMLIATIGSFVAPIPPKRLETSVAEMARQSGVEPPFRHAAVIAVGLSWAFGIYFILNFMYQSFTFEPVSTEDAIAAIVPSRPNGFSFLRENGPTIVFLTVLVPAIVAALINQRNKIKPVAAKASDSIFSSIVVPLMDLTQRLGWGFLLVLALVLTYRFADLVWGAFAYPFYLGENFGALTRTNDEIALASKTFGVIMTIAGSGLGAVALIWLGRMPCLVLGALIAAATNLLFADLAAGRFIVESGEVVASAGGQGMTAFLSFTRLDVLLEGIPPLFGLENSQGLTNLMGAIAGENLAVGFASVASVAYLTSIVNPKYAAVQYALLASLTMLIGSLGRAPLGELIETDGFYTVFVVTFWIGLVPVVLAGLEWLRQARSGKPVPEQAR